MVRLRGALRKPLGKTARFVRTETLGRVGRRIEERQEFQRELRKARKEQIPEAARAQARRELILKPKLRAQVERKRLLAASRRASTRVSSSRDLGLTGSGGLDFLVGMPTRKRPITRVRKRKSRRNPRGKTITFRI